MAGLSGDICTPASYSRTAPSTSPVFQQYLAERAAGDKDVRGFLDRLLGVQAAQPRNHRA